MIIHVVSGKGEGTTLLSAFDNALEDAGVYNYNIVPLSSIIPPQSKVVKEYRFKAPADEYGHRLYVVKAEIRSAETDKFIASGLGWYQFGDDNRGVFVEHETKGDTAKIVRSEIEFRIKHSLKDLCRFRNVPFHENRIRSLISVAEIKSLPTSVLVMAAYQSEGWK